MNSFEIVDYIKETDVHILIDEMYEHLVYEREHISLASYEEIKDKVISVFGFSKSYANAASFKSSSLEAIENLTCFLSLGEKASPGAPATPASSNKYSQIATAFKRP